MDSEDIPEPENVKILNIQVMNTGHFQHWMIWRDQNQSRAWQPLRVAFPSGQSARLGHAGALSSDGKIIYYFGGVYAQTESREYISNDFAEAPMTQVLKFDTTTRNWSIIESTNGDAPTPRSFHTAISGKFSSCIVLIPLPNCINFFLDWYFFSQFPIRTISCCTEEGNMVTNIIFFNST